MMHEKPCVYVWSYWEDHTWRLCISNWIVKLAERLVTCTGQLLGHGASCHRAFPHSAQLLCITLSRSILTPVHVCICQGAPSHLPLTMYSDMVYDKKPLCCQSCSGGMLLQKDFQPPVVIVE